MDHQTKQSLIRTLSKASSKKHPVTIRCNGRAVTVILPVQDHQTFQEKRKRELDNLKTELNGIVAFIHDRIRYHALEEVEAQLAAHRQKIEKDKSNLNDPL
jgi:PHD/YefM family antitoxin component YafN of YafNO toxin-antitoxin module